MRVNRGGVHGSAFNRSQFTTQRFVYGGELDFFLYRPNPRAFLDAYIDIAHRRVAKISVEEKNDDDGDE